MERSGDFLLMLVLLLGMAVLGSSLLDRMIRVVAVQGIAVGALLLVEHHNEITGRLAFIAVATIVLKGFVMPLILDRSIRESTSKQEVEPFIGFTLSLILGAVAIGVAFGLSSLLELPDKATSSLIVPVSLATVFMGLLVLVSRRKAVAQVVGYLVLENGIYVFSLAVATSLPALVEMGVLLDVFVAVFVMGIAIYQINREFEHIDTARLSELHDLPAHGGRPSGWQRQANGHANGNTHSEPNGQVEKQLSNP